MRRRWTLVAMVAGARLAVAGPALDDARKDVEGSDYLAARTALDKALHDGTASPDELADIYKLSGIVAGALGEDKVASEAFGKWLELDAKGELPVGTSPKIERPFKAAAARARPIQVKADTESSPPSVTLVVVSDRGKLVAGVHVLAIADGGKEQAFDGRPGTPIALPAGHRIDVRVEVLDEHGNRVFELGSTAVPLVITGAAANDTIAVNHPKHVRPETPARPRPWYFQWWAWGGATVVLFGTSVAFGWETHENLDQFDELNRTSTQHPWSDAQHVATAAERDVLIADVAIGAAGVLALGTAILYLTRPHLLEHAPIGAVPVQGGAALVVGGHF